MQAKITGPCCGYFPRAVCYIFFFFYILASLASYSYITEVPAHCFKVNCFETEFKIRREQTILANWKVLSQCLYGVAKESR